MSLGMPKEKLTLAAEQNIASHFQNAYDELESNDFLKKSIQASIEKTGATFTKSSLQKAFELNAEEEAILGAVADMIEANNAVLEQQLIQLGILKGNNP